MRDSAFEHGGIVCEQRSNEAFRRGDFSALCTTGFTAGICNDPTHQLYDPTTHAAIPGDVLTNDPNFTPSTVMTNVFDLLPPTNGSLTNNVIDTTIRSTTANLFDIKIDHNHFEQAANFRRFRLRQYEDRRHFKPGTHFRRSHPAEHPLCSHQRQLHFHSHRS